MRRKRNGLSVTAIGRLPYFHFVKIKVRTLSAGDQIPGVCVVQVVLPPRYDHRPVVHRRTREWMVILRGSGRGKIGRRLVRFKPGVIVYMPPGTPHQMSTGASPLEALVLFTPPIDVKSPKADICLET